MKVSKYLKENDCVMDLNADTKEKAIREIAVQLSTVNKGLDSDKFVEDILEREGLGSTGIGHNIAIPHARTDSVSGFVIGFGKSIEGIDFKSIDGKKVHLIFLMGASPKDLNFYLRLLAELSKLFMNPSFRRELMLAQTAQEVIAAITKFETI
jgi:fructose-specific phosphotransferase system IIA component